MRTNEQLIERLFTSLDRGDFQSVADCYRDDAEFRDIAFDLKGKGNIAAMWHLVCSKQTKVSFCDIKDDDFSGTAHWEALYQFSRTNQLVHNEIDSTFTFRDGKILVHRDQCDRWLWARQALGVFRAIPVTVLPFLLRWAAAKELRAFKQSLAKAPPMRVSHKP
jgi:ketosteroid isomerase-like protein